MNNEAHIRMVQAAQHIHKQAPSCQPTGQSSWWRHKNKSKEGPHHTQPLLPWCNIIMNHYTGAVAEIAQMEGNRPGSQQRLMAVNSQKDYHAW